MEPHYDRSFALECTSLANSTRTVSSSKVALRPPRIHTNGTGTGGVSAHIDDAVTAPVNAVPSSLSDIFLHPVIAIAITVALIALCTWWISWLREFSYLPGTSATSANWHSYTILYLIPVAVAAAFMGMRGGVAATVCVLVVTRMYLISENAHNETVHGIRALFSTPSVPAGLEMMTLTMGTLAIAAVAGRLRSTLVELRMSNGSLELANANLAAANHQLIESETMRREFNRDVLLAVTNGKLQLVEADDLPGPEFEGREPVVTWPLREPLDATLLRQELQRLVAKSAMDAERTVDLLTGATEAATNAIKHGNGGEARIWIMESCISVLIKDEGEGIAPTHLARATLEKGYSTRISLGMGFHLMLETCDRLLLSTGENGTAILMSILNSTQGSEGDRILARYLKDFDC
jgi:anti-sigma regulatory factor (Ser/Thr protein kinase)